MARIEDHDYLKLCAQLASLLSISISSARRKVEILAAKEGARDTSRRKIIAEKLLSQALLRSKDGNATTVTQLDQLLIALAEEENFMIED